MNPEPVVCVEKIPCSPRGVRIMGANQDTLKIEYNGMSYLKFRAKDLIEKINKYPADAQLSMWPSVSKESSREQHFS